ncbi:dienelactone hydrolase family protein [Methylocella sp. CPCC 101449]|uniref:dienelactone hydrolase family protein n=1 Tax=Methylocella sp. CPCC 101449 TaxID=2987531 RepID=UPI0028920E68|nr:dienelactone hydrolase family protein [Methylocella sp. CPCC 101449]MDT2023345.1 dienelactone hydrolase family protein [Methylocella sp. CPCC 101449]
MGTRISWKRPDGKEASGYFVAAGAPNAPSVVVIQEWWGLQDQITGIADRFAAAGYNALAPDLYGGVVVPYHDREAAGKQMGSLNFLDAVDQSVRGAAQFLQGFGSKVAITGFCMGGAVSILAACRVSEFACAVPFYGIPPEAVAKPADVKIPLQCHFANTDDWCTPAAVNGFEAGLKAAGKSFELYRYDAEHGFVNEQRTSAHARQETELAWSRTLAFLKKHLA